MKSVNRALDVLFEIAGADHPMTALALSRQLELPRPTVYRILDTLEARGIVARIEDGTVITSKLGLLLGDSAQAARLSDLIKPYLQRLVSVTKETSSLHVRVGDLRRCVSEVEGYHGIRWARGPGFTAPVWSGAVGYVILAGLAEADLDVLLSEISFSQLASNTAKNVEELRERVEKARIKGWSASQSETVDGAAAVAAPMLDVSGDVVGVLSLYAAADRFHSMQEFVPELLAITEEAANQWMLVTSIHSEPTLSQAMNSTATGAELVAAEAAVDNAGQPGTKKEKQQ